MSEKADPDDNNTDIKHHTTEQHSADGLKSGKKSINEKISSNCTNTAEPDQRRPYSSSSEGSETDVAGEVDHLHLRWEFIFELILKL